MRNDYYPFGLTFNLYSRENSTPNRFKFQGQEHIDDLDLGWVSFKWRNHQPDIGRFFNIDPLADKYVYNSPYAFSENHVTTHIELEGLEKLHFQARLSQPNENQIKYKQDGNLVSQVNFTLDMEKKKVDVTSTIANNPFALEFFNGDPGSVDFEPELSVNDDGSFSIHGDLSFFGATDLDINVKMNDGNLNISTSIDDVNHDLAATVLVADESVSKAGHNNPNMAQASACAFELHELGCQIVII